MSVDHLMLIFLWIFGSVAIFAVFAHPGAGKGRHLPPPMMKKYRPNNDA